MGWLIVEHINDKPELVAELKKRFPGCNLDVPERRGRFDLKPETLEEIALEEVDREMRRRPHHPKGEGYRP